MLQDLDRIIVFDPERGHERFINLQDLVEMPVMPSTQISSQYHQIKVGGEAGWFAPRSWMPAAAKGRGAGASNFRLGSAR